MKQKKPPKTTVTWPVTRLAFQETRRQKKNPLTQITADHWAVKQTLCNGFYLRLIYFLTFTSVDIKLCNGTTSDSDKAKCGWDRNRKLLLLLLLLWRVVRWRVNPSKMYILHDDKLRCGKVMKPHRRDSSFALVVTRKATQHGGNSTGFNEWPATSGPRASRRGGIKVRHTLLQKHIHNIDDAN